MTNLLLAILSSASMAIALKLFHTQKGNRFAIIMGNYLTCILIGFVLIPDKSPAFHVSRVTLLCSLAAGFFFVAALVLMQSSIQTNGAVLTSAFSKLGIIIPLLISTIFLGERPGKLQILGIILVLAAILLINAEPAENHYKPASSLMLLILCLAGTGAGDAMAKIFEHNAPRGEEPLYFFFLFLIAELLTGILAVHEYRVTGKKLLLPEFLAGIAVGIPNYFSSFFLVQALEHLPAFLVYTCFSTGTILVVTAVSIAVFKERPGRLQFLGLGFILASLVLLNL